MGIGMESVTQSQRMQISQESKAKDEANTNNNKKAYAELKSRCGVVTYG